MCETRAGSRPAPQSRSICSIAYALPGDEHEEMRKPVAMSRACPPHDYTLSRIKELRQTVHL